MSVSRVTMVDYMGEEAADEIEVAFREICPQILSSHYYLATDNFSKWLPDPSKVPSLNSYQILV